jgi:hypothetical protein
MEKVRARKRNKRSDVIKVLPSLLDHQALRKTKIILTDQDREMMSAIDNCIKSRDKVWGDTVRRICKWHKVSYTLIRKMRPIVSFVSNFSKQYFLVFFGCLQVDRNYLKKVKPFVKVYADAVFHLWVKEWFYSFADYIETKHEEEYFLAKLQCYINMTSPQSRPIDLQM